ILAAWTEHINAEPFPLGRRARWILRRPLFQQMRDGIRVVAQEGQLLLPREVDPFVLVDEVPHEQHPQAHVERVVEISPRHVDARRGALEPLDRKSTRLNSSHGSISYAVFCLKKKTKEHTP